MSGDRVTLTIEVRVKRDKATALKRLYEAQESMSPASKYHTRVRNIADSMVDDVLVDIKVPTKKNIKQAIIAWEEP